MARDELRGHVDAAVADAIEAVNATVALEDPLRQAPEELVIGGRLDSLGVLVFASSLEEMLERRLGHSISVFDLIADDPDPWTIERLKARLCEVADRVGA